MRSFVRNLMMNNVLTNDEIDLLTGIFKDGAPKQKPSTEYRYKVVVPFLTPIILLTPLKPHRTLPFPILGEVEGYPLSIHFCW